MFQKIKEILSPKHLAHKYEKYEKYISPIGLIGGFIIDNLTLNRADIFIDNVIIVIYLIMVCAGICVLNMWKRPEDDTESTVHFWAQLFTQFAFGGLFSNFLVFYIRSSSIATSFLFILFITLNLIGSEFLKKQYMIFSFQVTILFLAFYSYSIFLLPVIFRELSVRMFLFSGALSLAFVYIFLWIFFRFAHERFADKKKVVWRNIGIIFVFINILYFTNIIPPVPLTLKDVGVYHNLSVVDHKYNVYSEAKSWTDYFKFYNTVHYKSGETLYVYSAVFSPTDLNTSIVHDWQYFDEAKNRWISVIRAVVPIVGGRENGYRLYSSNTHVFPALWRVDIETKRGQVIGRIKFRVEKAVEDLKLVKEVK